ncbi:uncharacterized protein CIMG_02021 [Coccidioides immitis RS]|uniref:JmjC domain-containing protein n=1 Tax=Coccidioides immitis (strain RS) TaxID=246410 RepID=J3KKG7_COCIM|nr:uncharacterized protein CIMG_02021 [Coccidioides immitis RS]EAS36667.3 hypothetical protein CIMG_02021 [Coccidioides immitis RS]
MKRHIDRCQRHQTTSGASNQPLEHRNSAELVALLDEISSLQSDRKFPECELGNLELLVDGQELHWTRPALIPISEVWDEQFSPLDIFDAVRSSIKDLPPNCVYRDGEPITEAEQEWNISNAFYQAGIPLHNSDLSAKSSLMNVPLPGKFRRLRPCQALRNQLRIASDHNLDLLANFAPAGTFVDIHLDQNQHGLSQSVGYSKHIWLLYPPTKENLRVFAQSSGESGCLSKISGKLVEGCIARVDSSRVVYLPLAGYMPPSQQNLGHWLGSTSNLLRVWRLWPGVLPYTSHIYTRFLRRCWKISVNMPEPYCSFLTTNMTLKSSQLCSRAG